MIKARIQADNVFVTWIKENTVYESILELNLPEHADAHILKDELIYLTGSKAKANGLSQIPLRRVVVYNQEKEQSLELITNNTHWSAATIGAL